LPSAEEEPAVTATVALHPTQDRPSASELEDLRRALEEELRIQRLHADDLDAVVESLTGHTDSDSVLEREVAAHGRQRALEVIEEIQLALGRIGATGYGTCECCHRPIAVERLQAIPFTRHCVACPPPIPPSIG
jgi:RNA polymerase-binding transcription factor DksA